MARLKVLHAEADKDSLLVHKQVEIVGIKDNVTLKTPHKILDFNYKPGIKNLNTLTLTHIQENCILETSKLVNPDAYKNAVVDPYASYLSDSYSYLLGVPYLKDKVIINTLTFKFNPYSIENSIEKSKEKLGDFLNIYYNRSDFLFVPNIKVYNSENKKRKLLIERSEYVKYISESYDDLDFKNKKTIFIPISFKYGVTAFREMIKDFIDQGYHNFWLDFEGSSSMSGAPHIRGLRKIIDKKGLIDKILLYATNIRREQNPNPKDDSCGASDILSAPLGIDFVGVNRAPQAGGGNRTPLPTEVKIAHKARFLNKNEYNYTKYSHFGQKDTIYKKYNFNDGLIRQYPTFLSNYANSFEMNYEFGKQIDILHSDESVIEYLKGKKAIKPEQLKRFEKIITGKIKNKRLDDFL